MGRFVGVSIRTQDLDYRVLLVLVTRYTVFSRLGIGTVFIQGDVVLVYHSTTGRSGRLNTSHSNCFIKLLRSKNMLHY